MMTNVGRLGFVDSLAELSIPRTNENWATFLEQFLRYHPGDFANRASKFKTDDFFLSRRLLDNPTIPYTQPNTPAQIVRY